MADTRTDASVGKRLVFRRVTAMFSVPLGIATTVAAAYVVLQIEPRRREYFTKHSSEHLQLIAKSIALGGKSSDTAAERLALAVRGAPALLDDARLLTSDGQVAARAQNDVPEPANVETERLELTAPVPDDSGRVVTATFRRVSGLGLSPALSGVPLLLLVVAMTTWLGSLVAKGFTRVFEELVEPILRRGGSLEQAVALLRQTTQRQQRSVATNLQSLSEVAHALESASLILDAASKKTESLTHSAVRTGTLSSGALGHLEQTQATVGDLAHQMQLIANQLDVLVKGARLSTSLVNQVHILAERSHLLALNAAMEAARSESERGGFGIVSRQMRSLAEGSQRSADRARDILQRMQHGMERTLVDAEESHQGISLASNLTEGSLRQLRTFAGASTRLTQLIESLSAGMKTQGQSIEDIRRRVVEAGDKISQQENALLEVGSTADALKAVGESLSGVMNGEALGRTRWWSLTDGSKQQMRRALRGELRGVPLRRGLLQVWPGFVLTVSLAATVALFALGLLPHQALNPSGPPRAEATAAVLANAARTGDRVEATALARQALESPELIEVTLLDRDGRTLVHETAERADSIRYSFWVEKPAAANGQQVGTLRLKLGLTSWGLFWGGMVPTVIYLVIFLFSVAALGILRSGLHAASILEGVLRALRTATRQLDETVPKLAAAASQHAETAEAVAHFMQTALEVAGALKTEASDSATRSVELVRQSRGTQEEAASASRTISSARAAMLRVKLQMSTTVSAVRNLSHEATAVGAIAHTVRSIAERSNLLAHNAALEASRAKEEGRGFAVVATEMRTLAEGTKKAAAEIQSLLPGLQKDISFTVVGAEAGERSAADADSQAQESAAQIEGFASTLSQAVAGVGELAPLSTRQGAVMGQLADHVAHAKRESLQQKQAAEEVQRMAASLVELSESLLAALSIAEVSRDNAEP